MAHLTRTTEPYGAFCTVTGCVRIATCGLSVHGVPRLLCDEHAKPLIDALATLDRDDWRARDMVRSYELSPIEQFQFEDR